MNLRKCPECGQAYGVNDNRKIGRKSFVTLFVIAFIAVFFLGTRFEKIKDGTLFNNKSLVMGEKVSNVITLEEVESRINDIGELSTVEYLYSDAGKFTDAHQIKDFNIPLTTKSFIVKWDGSIKAGIDLAKLKVNINEDSKTIVMHLPKAEILSHEIDENSLQTLDETKNIFNPISVDDVATFIGESKDYMEEKAVKNGLLDKAIDNVQTVIKEQLNLNSIISENYTLRFEITEE